MDRSEIRAIKARKANDMRRKAEAAADNAIASRAEREGEASGEKCERSEYDFDLGEARAAVLERRERLAAGGAAAKLGLPGGKLGPNRVNARVPVALAKEVPAASGILGEGYPASFPKALSLDHAVERAHSRHTALEARAVRSPGQDAAQARVNARSAEVGLEEDGLAGGRGTMAQRRVQAQEKVMLMLNPP